MTEQTDASYGVSVFFATYFCYNISVTGKETCLGIKPARLPPRSKLRGFRLSQTRGFIYDGTVEEFVNVGGNSWLSPRDGSEYIVIASIDNECTEITAEEYDEELGRINAEAAIEKSMAEQEREREASFDVIF